MLSQTKEELLNFDVKKGKPTFVLAVNDENAFKRLQQWKEEEMFFVLLLQSMFKQQWNRTSIVTTKEFQNNFQFPGTFTNLLSLISRYQRHKLPLTRTLYYCVFVCTNDNITF